MNVRYSPWNKPRKPTENELKALMVKEGMKPFHTVMERNEFQGVHSHKHDETRMLVSGSVEFCAEGRSFTMKPGDRLDIKANTAHTAKNLEKGQSVVLCATKGKTAVIEIY
jgi:quercetin dioxygenase-like cupin family protein